jgi:hypothetical protein
MYPKLWILIYRQALKKPIQAYQRGDEPLVVKNGFYSRRSLLIKAEAAFSFRRY